MLVSLLPVTPECHSAVFPGACETVLVNITDMPSVQKQPRTGWVYRGVEKPESIADHMYRMAVLAMTVAGSEYDQSKLVKMAIVHDLAEAIVGDITPVDGVSQEDKYSRELAALREIQTMIGMNTAVAQEVGQLWCVLTISRPRSVL